MAFFKRVFSSDYRRAVAAEAAGDYLEAARAYALAGERDQVGRMHLLRADKAPDREARLRALRDAARFCSDEVDGLDVLRVVGRRLFEMAQASGVISEGDRTLLREAAELFRRTGDGLWAGEAFELLGEAGNAADAYQAAGEVEHLEAVLAREDERRRRAERLREATAAYSKSLAEGARTAALTHLHACASLDPDGLSSRLADELAARRITNGSAALRFDASRPPDRYAGAGPVPVALGRDPACAIPLRDTRISRRHSEIVERDGRLLVRDAGSRNGTRVGGVTIDEELPLDGEGRLGLGDAVTMGWRRVAGALRLEVIEGTDRGLVAWVLQGPVALPGGALRLRFAEGLPLVDRGGGVAGRLLLDGALVEGPIELIRGDTVRFEPEGGGAPLSFYVE